MEEELRELEEDGWRALSSGRGAEFYDAFMTDEAIMVLPIGVLDRQACVEALREVAPWSSYRLEDVRLIPLGDNSGTLVYRAIAQRDGQPEYHALMSTTYVRQDDEWLIACHQQTPTR